MGFSEPFLEAVPNVYILLTLYMRNRFAFIEGNTNFYIFDIDNFSMFWTTFNISVFSASMGISKFLKVGPCQIVPSDKWHLGIFLVFISVVAMLISKGFVLAGAYAEENADFYLIFTIWFCCCILPNFIYVSIKSPWTQIRG